MKHDINKFLAYCQKRQVCQAEKLKYFFTTFKRFISLSINKPLTPVKKNKSILRIITDSFDLTPWTRTAVKINIESSRITWLLASLLLLTPISSFAHVNKDEIEQGRVVSTQCAVCHGQRGEGNGLPKSCLACLDENSLSKHIRDFQSGKRKNYIMEKISKNLSEQDVDHLFAYYASLEEEEEEAEKH